MDVSTKSPATFLNKTIGHHPGAAFAAIAVIIVLILILAYTVVHYKARCPKSHFEGLANNGEANPCGLGEVPVVRTNPDGTTTTSCYAAKALPGPPVSCRTKWDPAAAAEAQALATVGTFQHDTYGERQLQQTIDEAYDAEVGASEEQLGRLSRRKNSP